MKKQIILTSLLLIFGLGIKAQIENKRWCYVMEKSTTLQDYKYPSEESSLKLNSKDGTYNWGVHNGKYTIKGNELTLLPSDPDNGLKRYRFSIATTAQESLLCLQFSGGGELISTYYFVACPPFD